MKKLFISLLSVLCVACGGGNYYPAPEHEAKPTPAPTHDCEHNPDESCPNWYHTDNAQPPTVHPADSQAAIFNQYIGPKK